MRKLFITVAVIIQCSNAANAQSSSNTNNWTSARFLGWGTTSGDLPFRTNNVTRMTLQNNTGNLGIGTTTPASTLDVVGQVKITNGTQGAGKVLTSDANGLSSWQTPAAGTPGWNLTGNAGTVDGTNFIGTTDNVPFSIRVNNQKAGRIDHNSNMLNTFFGYLSGNLNSTGFYNTAIGARALASNTTGQYNTAIGTYALNITSSGTQNVAIGVSALQNMTNGNYNTATGMSALRDNTSGSSNTASGYGALFGNTTGHSNTGVGESALTSNTVGTYNTCLGKQSGSNSGINPSNFSALGYNSGHVGSNSNTIEIGNTSVSWIGGQTGWFLYSDERIKDNVQKNVPGLSFIKKLNPVTYNLNIHRQNEMCGINQTDKWEGKYDIEKIVQTGFLAQEVEQAAKECNYNFNGVVAPHANSKLYSVQYASFVMPLVKAVQELDEKNIKLEKLNAELKSGNEELISEIELIKAVLSEEQQQKLKSLREVKSVSGKSEGQLFQNFPNPFSEKTTIQYSVSKMMQHAQIKLFSAEGKEVKSFNISETGSSQIEIAGSALQAGIYNYTLYIDGKLIDTKQIILTK